MNITEAYKEHIEYTFNAFCRIVIRYAAIGAWHEWSRRRQRKVSFEYLTEEKYHTLNASGGFFINSYEEYPVTICGQTIMLTSGEFAEALSVLPRKRGKLSAFTFLRDTHNRRSGKYMDAAGVRHGITYIVPCWC